VQQAQHPLALLRIAPEIAPGEAIQAAVAGEHQIAAVPVGSVAARQIQHGGTLAVQHTVIQALPRFVLAANRMQPRLPPAALAPAFSDMRGQVKRYTAVALSSRRSRRISGTCLRGTQRKTTALRASRASSAYSGVTGEGGCWWCRIGSIAWPPWQRTLPGPRAHDKPQHALHLRPE
jgi:hypothetical protein